MIDDGTRRYRKAYNTFARKNGKTTTSALLSLYACIADGERHPQCFFVATKEAQARVGVDDARKLVWATPGADGVIDVLARSLVAKKGGGIIMALGSNSRTQDGFDPHFGLIDEYHEHVSDKMLNVIQSGQGARRQPMLHIVTTAGFYKSNPCYGYQKMVQQVLEQSLTDDSTFGIIHTSDDGDDWNDKETWVKSNPNLGVSVYGHYMDIQYTEAVNYGGEKEVDFLTKNLNIWTDAAKTWIRTEDWDASGSPLNLDDFNDRICYGGLDLAAVEDFNAFSLVFPGEDGNYQIFNWFWIPEHTVRNRIHKGLSGLREWIRAGHVFVTDGNTVDHEAIGRFIAKCHARFDIQSISYDRWGAVPIVLQLQDDGLEMEKFGQGYASMSLPTKMFKKLIMERRLNHGNNPVLNWMRSNVVIKTDEAGNEKPDKDKSDEKIDGVVSSVMAIGNMLSHMGETSAYLTRGMDFY